ncbi:MAG: hypothetical protein DMF57_09600 [Acidobacteria bacterium]|nr:MAG: hypothetical protein DMF57_09600 [Acidobacteriota bacterium]
MAHRIEFRKRSHEVSRLEAFSDVIFGFAMSLLVVSLEAPKSHQQLFEMVHGFVPFAICFFLFIDFWHEHYTFFKRYALEDNTTIVLNAILLFVILFYVYPLKFMFTLFVAGVSGEHVDIPVSVLPTLFVIYGIGFVAVYWSIAAMYMHAYRKRGQLQLNAVEEIDTRESIYDNFITGSFGILSMLVARWFPGFGGLVYFLLIIPKTLVPWLMAVKRRKSEALLVAG